MRIKLKMIVTKNSKMKACPISHLPNLEEVEGSLIGVAVQIILQEVVFRQQQDSVEVRIDNKTMINLDKISKISESKGKDLLALP